MTFSLDIGKTRSLGNLEQWDIIEFESQRIDRDIFMVVSVDKDDTIPALLLQLWKFDGGYNHMFRNVMENDFGINTQVPFFEPKKKPAIIEEIINFRPKESQYSKKEELFFDIWPEKTSEEKTVECDTPFEVVVRFEDGTTSQYHLPAWTPIQRLPLDRIEPGTVVEIWDIKNISHIMKVIQL